MALPGKPAGWPVLAGLSLDAAEVVVPDPAAGRVVHVVGRVTDEVFSFLGPATAALAASGLAQTVLLHDDVHCRHLLPRFERSIDLVLLPADGGPLQRWQRSLQALRKAVERPGLKAVHLHGFVPSLLGAYVARSMKLDVPMYYSPHGSKSLASLRRLGAFILWALRPFVGSLREQRAIASVAADARALHSLTDTQSIEVAESPVADAFFDVERHEVHHPLIVTGSRVQDARTAELFAQLAVLLSDEVLRLSFNWIGSTDRNSQLRLKTANVSVYDVTRDEDLASRLAAGWVYLAPGGTRGFPVFLAEAMAVGLPVVAVDTPDHRDIIRHGETGFLCRTEEEILHSIAQLIDSPALRTEMGQAARAAARKRFSEARFRDSLLSAYDLPTQPSSLPMPLDLLPEPLVAAAEPAPPLSAPIAPPITTPVSMPLAPLG